MKYIMGRKDKCINLLYGGVIMTNLAVIPARSGSKGLKDKNIKFLNGKPLMAYSIEAGIFSEKFDTVHVSTDSEEYATIARKLGADVPFLREAKYATDNSSTWDAIKNVIESYQKVGKTFENVAILQPTSPLRTKQHILNCFDIMEEKSADAVFSVCEVEHSPLICGKIPPNGSLKGFIDRRVIYSPRQELPLFYRLNGAIFLFKTNVLYEYDSIYDCNIFSYKMDKYSSVDIDTELDFKLAEQILLSKQ